jgi:hypothetical protein
MGKKDREERVKERESYVEKHQKQKTKYKLIALGVFGGVIAVLAISSYNFYELSTVVTPKGVPVGAGPLGGIHTHAGILTMIYGQMFDYSTPAYQIKSPYISFQKDNGQTIHMLAANVTMGYFFTSLHIGLTDKCFIFPDKRQFCSDDKYALKFYVNHKQVPSILDYVFNNNDRILISYGNENQAQINDQLSRLDSFNLIT